ncbi:hypothetical protein Nepgr_018168 [Nepenthes gracilis]|uniref:Bromo domain-containing protein n=1 Tax=Nepenthes gracilis TaxID=150966 RepID=A0AAD3SSH3_NEPGR|nr:hypothetical protein Nepgr_018168 [Nepenthes gracilis]
MGKVVEKKRKKKGRPSLLDLHKRSLKQQQEELQKQHQQRLLQKTHKIQNPNPNTAAPLRRSARRNPNPNVTSPASDDAGDEDDEQLSGKRREKKLKLVLKLPDPSLNSPASNSGSDSNAEDDESAATNHRKRKVDAIVDGSGHRKDVKDQNPSNTANAHQGVNKSDDGRSTPLPDKKLLLFILDRLQKKDTYGVFAEPVDPEELPDYHEVIQHPMDFSTIKSKLASGSYDNFEQFEKDVFLLCSNAMQYNASDTIYFRQARAIQELAKSNFENLRQDSDGNELEFKITRRGRPPTKNLKKPVGRPPFERATSELSGATLATGGENSNRSNYDLRKGIPSDKCGSADPFSRSCIGSRQGEAYVTWPAERCERTDEITGSAVKGISMKHGKKQIILDESRRNTYMVDSGSSGRQEPSILTVFDGERRQLVSVGLHSEYGYARSLARFAAKLGPVAWRVASKKIDRCLPTGVKFGPGWVGDNEAAAPRPVPQPSSAAASQPPPPQHLSVPGNPSTNATQGALETLGKPSENVETDGISEKHVAPSQPALDDHSTKTSSPSPATIAATTAAASLSEAVKRLNSHAAAFNVLNSSVGSPFQTCQSSPIPPRKNGVNGAFGFDVPPQMGRSIGAGPSARFNVGPRPIPGMVLKCDGNHVRPPALESNINSENSSPAKSSHCLPDSKLAPQPSWQRSSPQQKPGSIPPDLNVGFQSPGSPASRRPDSTQPDLVLQL